MICLTRAFGQMTVTPYKSKGLLDRPRAESLSSVALVGQRPTAASSSALFILERPLMFLSRASL
jgi:hypothetical protein